MSSQTNPYQNGPFQIDSPAPNAEAITPSDTVVLETVPRSLWVGVSGNVAVRMAGNNATVTFVGVQGLLPIMPEEVLATGTTATNIVGMW